MRQSPDLIERTLDALERLMKMFAFERLLYLACTVVSFAMLLISIAILFQSGQISVPQLGMIFGASGLIAASAARVSFFLNKSFDLISLIIQQLSQGKEP